MSTCTHQHLPETSILTIFPIVAVCLFSRSHVKDGLSLCPRFVFKQKSHFLPWSLVFLQRACPGAAILCSGPVKAAHLYQTHSTEDAAPGDQICLVKQFLSMSAALCCIKKFKDAFVLGVFHLGNSSISLSSSFLSETKEASRWKYFAPEEDQC